MLAAEEMHHCRGGAAPAGDDIDTDKLSYEIFSILESKFLFGYDDPPTNLWPPPPPDAADAAKSQRGKVRVLSIDGGGAAGGFLAGKVLAYLEQALKSLSGDPAARIADYFDLAAGTGVGGVFAAMLFATTPNPADATWRFLADRRRPSLPSRLLSCVFPAASGGGDRGMKSLFGDSLTLRDTVKPLLIPCYDLTAAAPLVFSRADALESLSFDFRLWEVCSATCAEPGRSHQARSVDGATSCVGVDGGIAAMGNPTAAAITHVLHNKQEFPFVRGVEDLLVLSLGGGGGRSNGDWARVAADGAADLVDGAVALAFRERGSSNYVRIQASGSTVGHCGADLDYDPSPGNVKVLLGAADEILKQKNTESVLFGGKRIGEQTNMEKLDWFAGELVLEHQRRSCRIAPTVAFKQSPPPKPVPTKPNN